MFSLIFKRGIVTIIIISIARRHYTTTIHYTYAIEIETDSILAFIII